MRGKAAGAALMLLAGMAAPAAANTLCGEQFASVPELEKALRAKKGIEALPGNAQYVPYSDPSTKAVWTFTTKDHPAHPAVACRRPIEKDGALYVQTDIACEGTKSVCDRLRTEFQELDRKMIESFRAQKRW